MSDSQTGLSAAFLAGLHHRDPRLEAAMAAIAAQIATDLRGR